MHRVFANLSRFDDARVQKFVLNRLLPLHDAIADSPLHSAPVP